MINIAGLAIGMAACIMILLYINYERSYDKWLPCGEYVPVQTWCPHPADGESNVSQMAAFVDQGPDQEGFPAGRALGLRA